MLSYEKALELIEFQKQQIEDLTAERDRLRTESANSSDALSTSNASNAAYSAENIDMRDALALLGIEEAKNELDGEG